MRREDLGQYIYDNILNTGTSILREAIQKERLTYVKCKSYVDNIQQ